MVKMKGFLSLHFFCKLDKIAKTSNKNLFNSRLL